MLYLRNRKTTEYKAVEPDSAEFYELTGQRDPDDHKPIWEQTGAHDAAAAQKRIDEGNIRPEDIGDDGQPVGDLTAKGAGADDTFGPDFAEPTPGEISQGAGRAADDADETFGQTGESTVVAERPGAAVEGLESIESGNGSSGSNGSKADLQREADELGLEVEGTGANGNVTKADLEHALQEHKEGASA